MSGRRTAASKQKKGRMPRTTVSFPVAFQEQLEKLAKKKKVSVGWLVREAVERYLAAEDPPVSYSTEGRT